MKTFILRLTGFWLNVLAVISPKAAGQKGFYIFCKPFAPPVTEKHLAFLNTSEKYRLDVNGIAIQTYRWGQGPKKILFLHGWQSHSFRWKKYIEMFPKEEFTLYALDAPAHGLSTGNFIHLPLYGEVIDKFIHHVGPLHSVVTHSFGGFAILYALHENPSLPIGRMVLTAIPGEVADFVKTFRTMLHLRDKALQATLEYWIEAVHHPPEYYSATAFAANLTIPGMIIHDKGDKTTPYECALDIHKAWKHAELITTDGLGHNLKSLDVIEWILDFVRRDVATQSGPKP